MGDDPHFSVVLPSNHILCYSIQGEHRKAYNLISNAKMHMNAVFLPDSARREVTWIRTLGLIFSDPPSGKIAIRLESNGSIISINSKGNFTAKNLASISVGRGGVMLHGATPTDGFRYSSVRVDLEDLGFSFSVKFMREHLDLFWHSSQQQSRDSDGLIGKREL